MAFDPEEHHRRSIRRRGGDYSQAGLYFVTVCAAQGKCLFGEIVQDKMALSDAGQVVKEEWLRTPSVRAEIVLNEFVVMPNHFHGVVAIVKSPRSVLPDDRAKVWSQKEAGRIRYAPTTKNEFRSPSRTLGAVVRGFKAAVTSRLRAMWGMPQAEVWQRNYYEHVIRNHEDYCRVRDYIIQNPARWAEDENNPMKKKG